MYEEQYGGIYFNSLIWLLILPSSWYTFPCKLVTRIRCLIEIISCTWWVWVFSQPVCWIVNGYYGKNLYVDHFWELKGSRWQSKLFYLGLCISIRPLSIEGPSNELNWERHSEAAVDVSALSLFCQRMHIKPDVRIIIMTSIPKRLIMVIGQSGLFCPIQSVIIWVIDKIGEPQSRSPIC